MVPGADFASTGAESEHAPNRAFLLVTCLAQQGCRSNPAALLARWQPRTGRRDHSRDRLSMRCRPAPARGGLQGRARTVPGGGDSPDGQKYARAYATWQKSNIAPVTYPEQGLNDW